MSLRPSKSSCLYSSHHRTVPKRTMMLVEERGMILLLLYSALRHSMTYEWCNTVCSLSRGRTISFICRRFISAIRDAGEAPTNRTGSIGSHDSYVRVLGLPRLGPRKSVVCMLHVQVHYMHAQVNMVHTLYIVHTCKWTALAERAVQCGQIRPFDESSRSSSCYLQNRTTQLRFHHHHVLYP